VPNDADSLTESDIEDDAVESEVVDTSGDSTADDAPASVYPDEAFETLADDDPDDLDDLDDLGSAGGTEAFDFEDAQFWLGEDEYLADERSVILVPASAEAISGEMAVPGRPLPRMSRAERRRRVRLQARRVRRVIRHVEPWSVLKISLLFYACLWVIFLVAGFMIWGVAESSGTVGKIETLVLELFALDTFTFDAAQIFRGYALGGLALAIAGTTFNVLMCLLFNLISDLTGGLRITMIEEETARPAPPRRSRRRAPAQRRTP
jgi:hypothetical protein